MGSAWTTEVPKPPNAEFDDFLALYRAFLEGKTAYPDKLRFKIKKTWDAYPLARKKEFTDRLIDAGVIAPEIVQLVRIFNGTITTLV